MTFNSKSRVTFERLSRFWQNMAKNTKGNIAYVPKKTIDGRFSRLGATKNRHVILRTYFFVRALLKIYKAVNVTTIL